MQLSALAQPLLGNSTVKKKTNSAAQITSDYFSRFDLQARYPKGPQKKAIFSSLLHG